MKPAVYHQQGRASVCGGMLPAPIAADQFQIADDLPPRRHTRLDLRVTCRAVRRPAFLFTEYARVVSDGRRRLTVQQAPRRGLLGAIYFRAFALQGVRAHISQALRIEPSLFQPVAELSHLEHLSSARVFDGPMTIEEQFADEQKVSVAGAKID